MLPGSRALAFASRWFDAHTVSTVFEPLVADWQREWREASRFARAGVRMRGGSAFLLSVIAASPNVLSAEWPANALHRVTMRVTMWTTVVTALMLIPFFKYIGRQPDVPAALYAAVLLVPQAAALALPFAITTIVDLIRTESAPTRNERIAAVKFAIAACISMFILVGWVYPAANQQFRVTMSRTVTGTTAIAGPAPGMNELSIVELLHDESLGASTPGRADAVMRNITMRLSLSLLPAAFMWMRWRALLLRRGSWYSALPLPLSAPLTFNACMFFMFLGSPLADAFYLPRWLSPSLGLAVLSIAAMTIDRLRRRMVPAL